MQLICKYCKMNPGDGWEINSAVAQPLIEIHGFCEAGFSHMLVGGAFDDNLVIKFSCHR